MISFIELIDIQKALNNYTLLENKVKVVAIDGEAIQASMALSTRYGEVIRHKSPTVALCDMYQWAGNREMQELYDCFEINEAPPEHSALDGTYLKVIDKDHARLEVVDIMHFDLSLLALTEATQAEIEIGLMNASAESDKSIWKVLEKRELFDNLQLRKWWTTKKVAIEEIKMKAIQEFTTLLTFAISSNLFDNLEDIQAVYQKKVAVNYERVKAGYNHVADKDMGNDKIVTPKVGG